MPSNFSNAAYNYRCYKMKIVEVEVYYMGCLSFLWVASPVQFCFTSITCKANKYGRKIQFDLAVNHPINGFKDRCRYLNTLNRF